MRDLWTFFSDRLVGAFHETGDGAAAFEYADDPGSTPVSLSLPFGARTQGAAAFAVLDNLLPDDPAVRERWARERGIGPDVFSLLAEYGQDVAGALTLAAEPSPPPREEAPLVEATDDDIAARITAIRRDSTSWVDPRVRPRMSLGGQQGKFTLAKVGERWFWPTWEVPSTHIFKPPSPKHPRVDVFEHALLGLAREVGLAASASELVTVLGQPVFVVERWDRDGGARLHAEDANQALGRLVRDKYRVTGVEVARLMAAHGLERDFVRQLAFNVAVGNADAHAKNYSLLLAGGRPALAPLYDTVPVILYGNRYDTNLAMPVGNASRAVRAGERAWRRFADEAGLDPGMVVLESAAVMSRVADLYEDWMADHGLDPARLRLVAKQVRGIRRAWAPPPGMGAPGTPRGAPRGPAQPTGHAGPAGPTTPTGPSAPRPSTNRDQGPGL